MAQSLVPSGGGGGSLVITVNATQAIGNINVLQARIIGMVNTTQNAMNRMTGSFSKFNSMLKSAVVAIGGFLAIRQVSRAVQGFISEMIAVNRTFTGFIASMKVIKGSIQGAMSEYEFLTAISNKLGVSVEDSITQYHRLAAAMKNVDKTGEMTRNIFSGISQAAVVLHSKGRDVTLIFEAIQQMASKGKLSLEELQRQLGNTLPGAISISARAMMDSSSFMEKGIKTVGEAEQELRKQISKGTINVYEYLIRFSNQLKKEYGEGVGYAADQFTANFNRMRNAIFEFYRSVGSSKAMESLTKVIQEIAGLFNDTQDGAAAGLGQTLGNVFEDLAGWISRLDSSDVEEFFQSVRTAIEATMTVAMGFFEIFKGFGSSEMETPLLDFVEFVAKSMAAVIDVLKVAAAGIETVLRSIVVAFDGIKAPLMAIGDWTGIVSEESRKAFQAADAANLAARNNAFKRFTVGEDETTFDRVGKQFTQGRNNLLAKKYGVQEYQAPSLGVNPFGPQRTNGILLPNKKAGMSAEDTAKYFNPMGNSELQKMVEDMQRNGVIAPNSASGKKSGGKSTSDPSGNAYLRETTRLVKDLSTAQNELDNVMTNKNRTEGQAVAQMKALISTDERYMGMSKAQKDQLLARAAALDEVNKKVQEAIQVQTYYNETLQSSYDTMAQVADLQNSGYVSQYNEQRRLEDSFKEGGENEFMAEENRRKMREAAMRRDMEARILDMERFRAETKQSNSDLEFQASLYGKSALEIQKMTAYRQIDLQIQRLMVGATVEMQQEYLKLADILKNEVSAAMDKVASKQQDTRSGIEDGLNKYMDSIRDKAGQMSDLTVNALRGMEDAFVQFAETGKLSFEDLTRSIVKDLIRIIVRMMMLAMLQKMTGLFGGGVGSTTVGTTNMGGGLAGYAAHGALFTGQNAKFFAHGGTFTNKLFSQATPFMFANGGGFSPGVMGEKGAEAVVPLGKTRSGDLGVKVADSNGGGNSILNLTVEVYKGEGDGVTAKHENTSNGDILKLFIGEVAADIKRGGQVAGSITQVYGLKRTPKSYA